MKRMGMIGITVTLLMTCVLTSGCADKEKKQIAALQAQYNELSAQNTELRNQLSLAETDKTELLSQLQARQSSLADKDSRIASLQSQLAAKPVQNLSATSEGWDVGKYADRVTLASDILFSAGSATLTGKGKSKLDKIASDIKSSYPGKPIRVYGHTDADPIKKTKRLWADNLDLSANRAMAVARYLMTRNIPAADIESVGKGATDPIAGNDSRASKAKNRRVEIVVIKN